MSVHRIRRVHLLAIVALVSLGGAPGCQKARPSAAPPKPPEVLVSRPTSDEITDYEDFTGRAESMLTVEVRARVTGYLDKVHFQDGSEVEEDALLFEIDPRPYQAAFERAVATLAQADARQKRSEADFGRASALFNRGSISREEFDRIADEFAESRGAVGIARADRDLAKLNLEFTKVTAPIPGRISRRMVDPGNLVKADDTMLTTIVSLDPMFIYFDVDERTLLRIRRLIREGKVRSRTEAEVPVLAALADEEDFPHRGVIDFSENKVDPNTGTLRVRGLFQNPAPRVLSPGLFIRVRLPIGEPHESLMIAEQAVGTDQGRKFLYVVDEKDEVIYRPVKVGALNDGKRVIEQGLKPDERVVVSGLQRIRPGAKVVPKPAPAEEEVAGRDLGEGRAAGQGPLAKGRAIAPPPPPGG